MGQSSLKLETIPLNDCHFSDAAPVGSVIPTESEVYDAVAQLWRQEPELERAGWEEWRARLKAIHPGWSLSVAHICRTLEKHCMSITGITQFTYHELVTSKESPALREPHLAKVQVTWSEKGKGLVARRPLAKGELVFAEDALSFIPPLEKSTLVHLSKACGSCGTSLSQNRYYYVMNNLDCDNCTTIWCTKGCRNLDTTHDFLKHPMSRNKRCSAQKWLKFEQFCKENTWHSAYSVGVMFARYYLHSDRRLQGNFESLAEVSQRVRLHAADTMNSGAAFDLGVDLTANAQSVCMWEEGYGLFCDAFPLAKDEYDLDFEKFLRYVGKFNLNQVNGQIYMLLSHLNHSCEPNIYYELEGHHINVYARKEIKSDEELTVSYVNPLHDVDLRRRELRVNWGFLCLCDRCKREISKKNIDKAGHSSTTAGPEPQSYRGHRRKSSLRASKPTLQDLLENGKEFDIEIPSQPGFAARRASVRFDSKVVTAVEERQ